MASVDHCGPAFHGALEAAQTARASYAARYQRNAEIIAESYEQGVTVCAVARRHGLPPAEIKPVA